MSDWKQSQGTTLTWTSSGGDYAMDMSSLANAAGRAGGKVDLGASHDKRYRAELQLDFNAAPTAGKAVGVYWASSEDNTDFDGEVTGSDAAYTDEYGLRRMTLIGWLVASNDTNPQYASWEFNAPSRYGAPVVWNDSGQALTSTGTDQVFKLTPLVQSVS